MRKLLVITTLAMIGLSACKKVDGEPTEQEAGIIMQKDSWRMTGYYDDGVDKLVNFTGYAFYFNADGTVRAFRNGTEHMGTWATTQVYSIADSVLTEGLKLQFDNTRPVSFLNKSWEVIEKTTKKVHLRTQDVAKGPYDDVFFNINY
jgi:hypothetical protein